MKSKYLREINCEYNFDDEIMIHGISTSLLLNFYI